MRRILIAIMALAYAGAAQATLYQIQYAGGPNPPPSILYLQIPDNLNANGRYDVVNVSGAVGYNDTITGLVLNPNQPNPSTSADGLFTFDNNFSLSAPYFDNYGLLFTGVSGTEFNLRFENGLYHLTSAINGNIIASSSGEVSISPLPVRRSG